MNDSDEDNSTSALVSTEAQEYIPVSVNSQKPKPNLLSLNTPEEDNDLYRALDAKLHRDMERTTTGITPEELGFEREARTVFGIPVKDGVTHFNLIAIPMASFASIMLFSYLSAQVIFLLDDPSYFNVPESKIGYISGLLIFVSLPFAIIGTAFVGYIYDILGRRLTLFLSFFIGSLLIAFVPWTSPYIFPWLILVRILI